MSGQYTADRVAAVLTAHGEAMTLKRQTAASPQTFSSVTVYGKRYRPEGQMADQVVGDVGQSKVNVKISNAEIAAAAWSGPPRKGDILVISGRDYDLIADADTRYDSGVIVMHMLTVVG